MGACVGEKARADQNIVGPRAEPDFDRFRVSRIEHGRLRRIEQKIPGQGPRRGGDRGRERLRLFRRREGRRHGGEAHEEFDGGNHLLNCQFMRPITRNDRDVGARVIGIALFDQRSQRLFGIGALQQRAMRALAHAPPQHVRIGLQPDRQAALGDFVARFLIQKGAAASGDHARPALEKTRHDAALPVAEISLAMFGENLGDRHSRGGFNLRVGVDERQAEPLRQAATGRSFTGSHEADKDDGAVSKRLRQQLDSTVPHAVLYVVGGFRAAGHRQTVACAQIRFKRQFAFRPAAPEIAAASR